MNVYLFLLSVISVPSSKADICQDGRCPKSSHTGGSVLLQKKSNLGKTKLNYEENSISASLELQNATLLAAEHAQFLIQASFGPTRKSLDELQATSYTKWIKTQMSLPIGSHRAYYREHLNPHWIPHYYRRGDIDGHFFKRPICDKGSRWHNHAFKTTDQIKYVKVKRGKIFVLNVDDKLKPLPNEQEWKSDIDSSVEPPTCTDIAPPAFSKRGKTCATNLGQTKRFCKIPGWQQHQYCRKTCYEQGVRYGKDDCSVGWAHYAKKDFMAFLLRVEESAKNGLLYFCKDSTCKEGFYMPNPSIWLADPSGAIKLRDVETNPALPGVIFLKESGAIPWCKKLSEDSTMVHEGKYFHHDARMALLENTPESPQTVSNLSCPTRNFVNEASCKLQPADSQGCHVACGSPGEVASIAVDGNHFTMWTGYRGPIYVNGKRQQGIEYRDTMLDNRFNNSKYFNQEIRSAVWIRHALQADDQLRQRMAWALAQILVIGPSIRAQVKTTETWMTYYDIFVRHAFGSFRDVLREVTYSPMMGAYLSYMDSKSFDGSGSSPDENYAREIMQLFSIGPDLLNEDGSLELDSDNVSTPAYTNENIMYFARVFTGLQIEQSRGNVENGDNYIDPMTMNPEYHDKYPKPDLNGGYLGDAYPLCTDLPKGAFLEKGARYEFLGYSHKGFALKLDAGSKLFSALSKLAVTVTLNEDVPCSGKECSLEVVDIIQVGNGFYEYVPPTCVHLWLANGRSIGEASRPWDARFMKCVNPEAAVAGIACCSGCTDNAPGAFTQKFLTCENGTTWQDRDGNPLMFTKWCNKNVKWRDWKACTYTCWKNDADWDNKLAYDGTDCSAGKYREALHCGSPQEVASFSKAQAVCQRLNMSICSSPEGKCSSTAKYLWTGEACITSVQVHDDDKVSHVGTNGAGNRFRVYWNEDKKPGNGTFTATVNLAPVFTSVPSKADLLENLKIGAFAPKSQCTHNCQNEVKAYSSSADVINEFTVFEHEGQFFRNVASTVQVNGFTFRNPPTFTPPEEFSAGLSQGALRRAGFAEVESLIDHLFYHPNTPVNIGKKLIQRFVSSNPSPAYLKAVGSAFKTGAFGGLTFSGKYGDLGATVAAILLHPEARTQIGKSNGLLREPLLKVIHFLRSMEYVEVHDEPVVLRNLQERIGQFPFKSPTVFNFYHDDHVPGFHKPNREPDPEPLVAPEFQVFTAPNIVNFLNGMTRIIDTGICPGNTAAGWGYPGEYSCDNVGWLNFSARRASEEVVKEMDVMLTGGRLTPKAAEIVKDAYESAQEGEQVKAAQKAFLLTPEFHNLGETTADGARSPKPKPLEHEPKPYKAVVMMYLAGGADTFQLLVPRDCSLHDEYAAVRQGMEIPIANLLPIKASTQKCTKFGIHPSMPSLHKLYQNKKAAFVSNIGNLMEPITRGGLRGGAQRVCPRQFSHSHAMKVAQTADCGPGATSIPRGTAGAMADMLTEKNFRSQSFSVSGIATWLKSANAPFEILSGDGSIRFGEYDLWRDAIDNITSQKHNNVYCDNYAQTVAEAIQSSEDLGTLLDDVQLESLDNYKRESILERQLYQVSRVIATRKKRKAERDFFFVQLGGWDSHQGIDRLPEKFKAVDDAIAGFVNELEQQNIFESVVLFTSSDFGRSLTFNGGGTDHGWGGNHFIVGGGINGGEVFNDFIETYHLNTDYVSGGRGRVVPKYPWESLMVPIAEWMGIDEPEKIFTNLVHFNRSEHIISRNTLFRSEAPAPPPVLTPVPTPAPNPAPIPPPAPAPIPSATPAPTVSSAYYKMASGACCCPEADQILTFEDCQKAHGALSLPLGRQWQGTRSRFPGGCSTRALKSLFWNNVKPGQAKPGWAPICKSSSPGATIPAPSPSITPSPTPAPTPASAYYKMATDTCCCPEADQILTFEDCQKAHGALSLPLGKQWQGRARRIPGGCSTKASTRLFWNRVKPGRARPGWAPICKKEK